MSENPYVRTYEALALQIGCRRDAAIEGDLGCRGQARGAGPTDWVSWDSTIKRGFGLPRPGTRRWPYGLGVGGIAGLRS